MSIGFILLAIGVIALLVKLGVLTGSVWGYTWPVILIVLGLSFLWGRRSRRMRSWWYRCWFPGQDEEKRQ